MNYSDFFNSGKQASLVSTIATFLGISPDRIKIVNVRSGSTIINMQILADTSNTSLSSSQ